MKMYTLINSYVAGIQVGIQAGHASIEYLMLHKESSLVKNWFANNKTFAWLDGGSSLDLSLLEVEMENLGIDYSPFREEGLDDCITAISFLLTDEEVQYMQDFRNDNVKDRSESLAVHEGYILFLEKIAMMRTKQL